MCRNLDSVEAAPGRANVYARLRGDGSRKALMFVHHMDVVPVAAEEWLAD